VGVEFLALPLTWHIAYTTACCYRTSRENNGASTYPIHRHLRRILRLTKVLSEFTKFG